jgi:hypothetical protein
LRTVVLAERPERIVVFIDEIDSTLQLDFTDDFFAAIRSTYNQRASNAAYKRLTFVLLGVAAPGDLIKDATRTPFNIGQPIDLREFDRADAQVLQDALERHVPGQGAHLMERIFFWTYGHPYLTQKLCQELCNLPAETQDDVDHLVQRLFLTSDARTEDINLKAVRSLIEQHPEQRPLLHLYARVYRGETITDDERSPYQNRLKLIGLLRSEGQRLVVRNEIYRRVFNAPWIKRNTPNVWQRMSPWQRVTAAATTVSLILIMSLVLFLAQQTAASVHVRMDTHAGLFQRSSDPAVQMNALYELCQMEHARANNRLYYMLVAWFEPAEAPIDRHHGAQHLFYNQVHPERLRLYRDPGISAYGSKLAIITECLYPPLPALAVPDAHTVEIGNAMCCALGRADWDKREHFEQRTGHQCTCEGEDDDRTN